MAADPAGCPARPAVGMTLAQISAYANLATLIVLVASAAAAVIQLRHVRTARELQAVLAIERRFAEPDIRAALVYVENELAAKLEQRAYRRELAARGFVDAVAHPEMILCNWFNEAGTLMVGGFLDEDVFFDSFGRLVEHYWRLLAPVVALLRRDRSADHYIHFERLAERAAAWRGRHPMGLYRRAAHRAAIVDPWLERDTVARAD
jgi:hypothetical protein